MKPPTAKRRFILTLSVLINTSLCLAACGGGGDNHGGDPSEGPAPRAIRVVITPASATVQPGATKQFNATVSNAKNDRVTWTVSDENGSDAAAGVISSAGVYTAPDEIPTGGAVTIIATSLQDSSKTASATVQIVILCSGVSEDVSNGRSAFALADSEIASEVSAVGDMSRATVAVDHLISPQTETFECSSVASGDMLTIASGTRGPLTIRNCNGTSTNPIIIRNDPDGSGPTVISRASGSAGGFIFSCNDCVGVAIDGSYKWQGAPTGTTYGIKVTMTGGGGPSAFLRIGGLSHFIAIRNLEIDGGWPVLASSGSGIRVNDHSVKSSEYPGLWREGILIEDNYVHDIESEGMYIGPNYRDGDLPLRNVEIRYNRIEDTGWEGINTKSMWEGDNSIHHNEVRRAGKNGEPNKPSQYSGIMNNAGTVNIYSNWIETTGQHGIQVWTQEGPKESEKRGPFSAYIWNNVILDAGGLWRSFMQSSFGISVGAQDGCEKPIPYIYNNTIVDSRESAISLSSNVGGGFVRDNIVAGTGSNPTIIVPGFVELLNNRVGVVSQMGFVDSGLQNFRLSVSSPAWNQGSSIFPPTDFDEVARPKDGAPDQGAFEGNTP